jgi:hypothetical protein
MGADKACGAQICVPEIGALQVRVAQPHAPEMGIG